MPQAQASKAMDMESTRLSVERKLLKGKIDELVNTVRPKSSHLEISNVNNVYSS